MPKQCILQKIKQYIATATDNLKKHI